MKKDIKMAKVSFHHKFNPNLADVFKELTNPLRAESLLPGVDRKNRTAGIEFMLADYIRRALDGKLSEKQLNGCKNSGDMFRLFVMYAKAARKEPGYFFVPAPISYHGDNEPSAEEKKKHRADPAQRIVVGPGGELVM